MNARYLIGLVVLLTSLAGLAAQDKKKPQPQQQRLPQLAVTKIKEGESYKTDGGTPNGAESNNTWAQVLQVIDDNNMLIGIDNGREGNNPRYFVTVWCKFPTKGITDGKTGFLASIIGTGNVTATGTKKYKTADGGTRTVFVLEVGPKDDTADKAAKAKADAKEAAARQKAEEKERALAAEAARQKDKAEEIAAAKLAIAKRLNDKDIAARKFKEIISMFPETKAADEAREMLKKLEK